VEGVKNGNLAPRHWAQGRVSEKEVTDFKHTFNDLHNDAKVFILMEGLSEILLSGP
jgi:hypothetical protein